MSRATQHYHLKSELTPAKHRSAKRGLSEIVMQWPLLMCSKIDKLLYLHHNDGWLGQTGRNKQNVFSLHLFNEPSSIGLFRLCLYYVFYMFWNKIYLKLLINRSFLQRDCRKERDYSSYSHDWEKEKSEWLDCNLSRWLTLIRLFLWKEEENCFN